MGMLMARVVAGGIHQCTCPQTAGLTPMSSKLQMSIKDKPGLRLTLKMYILSREGYKHKTLLTTHAVPLLQDPNI